MRQSMKWESIMKKAEPVPFFSLSHMGNEDGAADFKAAYDRTGNGRGFVRIHKMRKALGGIGWTRDRFDAAFAELLQKYIIEAHRGDPSVMTGQELEDSWKENRDLYTTVTWWG